jgi:hypothetical protein
MANTNVRLLTDYLNWAGCVCQLLILLQLLFLPIAFFPSHVSFRGSHVVFSCAISAACCFADTKAAAFTCLGGLPPYATKPTSLSRRRRYGALIFVAAAGATVGRIRAAAHPLNLIRLLYSDYVCIVWTQRCFLLRVVFAAPRWRPWSRRYGTSSHSTRSMAIPWTLSICGYVDQRLIGAMMRGKQLNLAYRVFAQLLRFIRP